MTILARSKPVYGQFTTPRSQPLRSRKFHTTVTTLLAILSLTVVALVSSTLHRADQIQEQIKAHALLNLSLQDLILQSSNLRHLANQHPAQLRLSLERNGYETAQSLLNQLSSRLAILEALPGPANSVAAQNTLRSLLIEMDQSVSKRQMIEHTHIDQWHVQLKKMHHEVNKEPSGNHALIQQLFAQNNTLGISLILISALPWFAWAAFKFKWVDTLRRKRRNKIIERASDSVTELLNQQGWLQILNAHHKSKSGRGKASSLALIQIDYFKQYNATYGPTVGDARLQKFAAVLSTNFRPQDTLARLENEQFAVLVPDCGAVETKRIIDRMRNDPSCEVEFSSGICELNQEKSLERITALADRALHKAREEGGNRSCTA